MTARPPGLFIAFEGGDGAGKSTQSALLRDNLVEAGHSVVVTREPGGTSVGVDIRRILLDPETGDLDPRTEVLLYAADRAEHLNRVIRPALAEGHVVITDRYVDSTYAYQGAGRALPLDEVKNLMGWATGGLVPDLTVLLDADPTAAMSRFKGRDRIEAAGIEFHLRVREGFLALAAQEPHRYVVLDARAPIAALASAIAATVDARLASRAAAA